MPRKTVAAADFPTPVAAASMRPRPDAAENLNVVNRGGPPPLCFNEAAARCRGKPRRPASTASTSPPLQ